MFSVHQDAQLLETSFTKTHYCYGDKKMNQLSLSSSIDSDGNIHISICNLDPNNDVKIDCDLIGVSKNKISGTILTSNHINGRNTFDNQKKLLLRILKM